MQIETLPLVVLIVAIALVFLATIAIVTGRSPEVLSRWVTFRADRDTTAQLHRFGADDGLRTNELQTKGDKEPLRNDDAHQAAKNSR